MQNQAPGPLRYVRTHILVRAAVLAMTLASFAPYYSRETGFTSFIHFTKNGHSRELPVVRQIPHYDQPGRAAYDGQYYAQLALVPLLTTPDIDKVLDIPSYRARRILASWTAHLAGFGDPGRVLRAYAAQNLAFLVLLGLLLSCTFPPSDWRSTAVWAACVLTPGLTMSVRLALPEALGATLVVAAIVMAERRHLWLAACFIGLAALARETFLLAIPILWIVPGRRLAESIAATALAVAPWLLWQDYLYSIYRSGSVATGGLVSPPPGAYLRDASKVVNELAGPWGRSERATVFGGVSMIVQLIFVVTRFNWRSPWWWCGSATAGLMLVVPPSVWIGVPRVFLPLAFSFNALLPRGSRWFWILFAAGNLFVLTTLELLTGPWR